MTVSQLSIAAALLSLPILALAQMPDHLASLDFYWQYGVSDVCAFGDYVYSAHECEGVRVFDASDLENVQELARLDFDYVRQIDSNGQALFISTSTGFYIYSLANPAAPVLCATLELDFSLDQFCINEEHLALVGTTDAWWSRTIISIYDISSPTEPDPIVYYTDMIEHVWDLNLQGTRLFTATGNPHLFVLDFSDPVHPYLDCSENFLDAPASTHVTSTEEYLYVRCNSSNLYVYNTETLELSNTLTLPVHLLDIQCSGDKLYASAVGNGLCFCEFDLSTPESPQLVQELDRSYYRIDFFVGSDRILLANHDAGFSVLQHNDSDELFEGTSYSLAGPVSRSEGFGDQLFLVESSGVRLVDLADPHQPELGRFLSGTSTACLLVEEDIAFLSSYRREIITLDLQDSNALEECGYFADERLSGALVRCGQWLVAAAGTDLLFLDAQNPQQLQIDVELDSGLSSAAVLLAYGDQLFVRNTLEGTVVLFDCSGASPVRTQTLDLQTCGIVLAGDKLYNITATEELQIADLNSLAGGQLEFQTLTGLGDYRGLCPYVAVDDLILMRFRPRIVAEPEDEFFRLGVFDNSNPLQPQLLDYMVLDEYSFDVNVFDDHLIVSFPRHVEIYDGSQFMLNVSQGNPLPSGYVLQECFPNPFNPSTTLNFTCPRTAQVKLAVYNLLGRRITTLADQEFAAGEHSITWEGRDTNGRTVASGSYFIVAEFPDGGQVRAVTLLK